MDDSAVQWLNDLKPSYQEAIKASDMGTIGQIMTYLGYDANGN
jgi:hypothetical protein